MNDIYNGETYDATKKLTGWDLSGYNDKNWISVNTANYNNNNLIASEGAPVRKFRRLSRLKFSELQKDNWWSIWDRIWLAG